MIFFLWAVNLAEEKMNETNQNKSNKQTNKKQQAKNNSELTNRMKPIILISKMEKKKKIVIQFHTQFLYTQN